MESIDVETKPKLSYEELEKKYYELENKMYNFFCSKVVTKLPFGAQTKPFYIEVMVSKETYKHIIMYNEIMHAIDKCEFKDISEAPQEIQEQMKREVDEKINKKMEEIA